MKEHVKYLIELNACQKAIDYAEQFKTLQITWDKCERGDWMLWLLGKQDKNRKKLVLTTCQCARLSLKFVPKKEKRPLRTIETVEKWANNVEGVSLEHVKKAVSPPTTDATYAANNAASVTFATDYSAAFAAANAAANAADNIVDKKLILKQCADIVREYYPKIKML